jgi:UDP-2-acetamido-3-amino-2,3-dideoxy-glucuronate N-acetyltransferase
MTDELKYFVHPSSFVDQGTTIGIDTKIWHFSHVCTTAQIGNNCVIGQNVYIGPGVIIGNDCKIQNNVSVYEGVKIGNSVFVGPSCVFTNDLHPVAQGAWKLTPTHIEDHVSIGANATIVCGVTLKRGCKIGAGAVVTKTVEEDVTVVGNPARPIVLRGQV